MTIDPNASLANIRDELGRAAHPASPEDRDARYYWAGQSTRLLLVHLDAGGQLPDAWTPFYAPAADLAAALQTIEHAAGHGHQADPRSIAGTLRAAINAWQNASPDEILPCGDDLAAATRALLDCQPSEDQPTHLELAATLEQRDIARAEAQRYARSRISDLIQQRDDYRAEILRATQDRDIARAEALSARSEMTRRHEAHVRIVDELRNEAQQHASIARNLAAQLAADDNPNAAYAAVARVASSIAENASDNGEGGTFADLKQAMSDTIGHATMFRTSEEATRVTLAAFLATGAARFGSRRKDDDLAQRTADYLAELASQLDGQPPRPPIER